MTCNAIVNLSFLESGFDVYYSNKGDHNRDGVWIPDLNYHRFLRFYFSVFSLALISIEKTYQTLKTVFDHISKHLEVRRIFNSFLGVWKCAHGLSCLIYYMIPKSCQLQLQCFAFG